MNQSPKVIVFDAFGTLVRIGESRSPYRKLMKWLKANGRKPSEQDAKIIMSNSVDIAQLAKIFGAIKPEQQIYKVIQAHFGCEFSEMLFIGDHPILDVEMPLSLGMSARLIERHKNQKLLDVV